MHKEESLVPPGEAQGPGLSFLDNIAVAKAFENISCIILSNGGLEESGVLGYHRE